jgi:hypothetical protein
VLDRVYVHGHPAVDVRRCIGLNSAHTAIVDSYVADCHQNGSDAQAIGSWTGPGPFKIVNNYMEASHEVIAFGGPTPAITGLLPSDIEIRRNHLTRPMSWKGVWQAKNILEMKSGQRVLFEGNVLENNWVDQQNGYAILLQTLSDDGRQWWVKVSDVTIRNNVLRNSAQGVNLLSRVTYTGTMPTTPMARIAVMNNLITNIGDPALGSSQNRVFQLLGDIQHLTIANNTVVVSGAAYESTIAVMDGAAQTGFHMVDNVFGPTRSGLWGNSTGPGVPTLTRYAPGYVMTGNVLVGANGSVYPAGNLFPATMGDVGFVDHLNGNYRLLSSSPVISALGRTPGADFARLDAVTAAVKLQ